MKVKIKTMVKINCHVKNEMKLHDVGDTMLHGEATVLESTRRGLKPARLPKALHGALVMGFADLGDARFFVTLMGVRKDRT